MDDKYTNFEIPPEIQLLAESLGFGSGYTRTYKAFVVYVLDDSGSIRTSGPRTDRYFKSRRFAQSEADRLNRGFQYRWNYDEQGMEKIDNPRGFAFVKEIEVTERVM